MGAIVNLQWNIIDLYHIQMKVPPEMPTCRFNRVLANLIPVIDDRSQLKTKIRLIINYILEPMVIFATMMRVCLDWRLQSQVVHYVFLSLRLLLIVCSLKLNLVDVANLTQLLIILQLATPHPTVVWPCVLVTLLQISFAFVHALSNQQRRGNFDQRLGLLVPFAKEVCCVMCAFFVYCMPEAFSNLYYPPIFFAVIHFGLCWIDDIYNFQVKRVIQGISLLCLSMVSILACLYLGAFERSSVMIIGVVCYMITLGWLLNVAEFSDFKIIEQNPNTFAEWDYKQYFEKLIHLLQNKDKQQNQEILRGFYYYHEGICFSAECPIRYCHELQSQEKSKETFYQQQFQTVVKYIKAYLRNQLQIATIRYPDLKRFYIFYISPSIEVLRYCDKDSFIELREFQRIETVFQNRDIEYRKQSNLNIKNEVKEHMELYLENSNYLWRLLYDYNIDFGRFQKLGIELLSLQERIKKYETNPLSDESTHKLIREFKQVILDQKTEKHRESGDEAARLYNFVDIHTKQHPIVIISAEPQTLQKIQNVNASFCRALGFSKKQLLEKKLNDILPEFMWDFHTKLMMQRSKELLYESEKTLSTMVYTVTRSGYLIESGLNILQLNSLKGRKWSCILKQTNQTNYVFITNGAGQIQGMTSNCIHVGMELGLLGKEIQPSVFEKASTNNNSWIPLEGQLDNLLSDDDVDKLRQLKAQFRMKSQISFEPFQSNRICIFEIELKKKYQRTLTNAPSTDACDENQGHPQQLFFNFPKTYSNYDYHNKVDIDIKEEEHYEFVNFGEGIDEMRYLNGQIQFKEDRSEGSFEKENTENSLVQNIDFNMKRQTYFQVLERGRKRLPKPLLELSVWLVVVGVVIVGIAIANFLIFYLNTNTYNTNASVLTKLNILRFFYSSIVHSSIEIGYTNTGVWNQSTSLGLQNIAAKLATIAQMSPLLASNQSSINTFSLNYQVSSGGSLYESISQFKLQTNNMLNNPNVMYDFNSSSPIYQLMNISVNCLSDGFSALSKSLLSKYSTEMNSKILFDLVLLITMCGVILMISLRIYFIVHRMTQEKTKLLSIYLELQEGVIQKVLEKNNAFKLMLKYNRMIEDDGDDLEDAFDTNSEEEKSPRKRVKSMSRFNYFYVFSGWALICAGIYAVNTYSDAKFLQIVNSNMNQLITFGEVSLIQQSSFNAFNLIAVSNLTTIQNQTTIDFAKNRIVQIYQRQMDFRESLLMALNQKLFSEAFSQFFLQFWVNNSCPYMTQPDCSGDPYGIVRQGGDQFWSFVARKLDNLASQLTQQTYPLAQNYFTAFGAIKDNYKLSQLKKVYSGQMLEVPHLKLLQDILGQISATVTVKTYIFSAVAATTLLGLSLFFGYCLNRMKSRVQMIEQIVGFIPFKKLATIVGFKKYIKTKYQQESN